MSKKIAVLIPCYNEEQTIKKVVEDFSKYLPEAIIYVYDNNSTDNTYEIAKTTDAIVRKELNRGKGNVVKKMFKEIKSDIYVLVDGDNTYPAKEINTLLEPIITEKADMTVGDRMSYGAYTRENKSNIKKFGNRFVTNMINKKYKISLNDVLSGYRAFNKKVIENISIKSTGFELETEITIQAIKKDLIIKEIPISYKERTKESKSKVNFLIDGMRILRIYFRESIKK